LSNTGKTHDSSYCICDENGNIIIHEEHERFSRKKKNLY